MKKLKIKLWINYIFFLAKIILIIVILEFLLRIFKVSPAAFALPSEVIKSIPEFLPFGISFFDTLHTLKRTLLAFFMSIPAGLLLGYYVFKTKYFSKEASFIIDFLRSIPATTLIPVFFIILGYGDAAKIAIGFYTSTLSITISVIVGFRSLNKDRKTIADTINLKGAKRFFYYEFQEIISSIFIGLRTGISLSLILIIVSEMFIGSHNGIGRIIMDMRYSDNVPKLYAAICVAGIFGYLLNQCILFFEKKTFND